MNRDSESILVVDDTPLNREVLSRQMQRSGYDVHTAGDGQEALDALAGQAFDLVLLDVVMPRVDGLEVLAEIRRTHPPGLLPVIMVTSRDQSADVIKALELGANDYVTKPLELAVVLARVQTQLAMKRSARTLARQAAVLDATTDVVLYADGAGRLSYLNQAGRDLLSVGLDDSLSDARLVDCLDDRSVGIFEQDVRSALEESGGWRGELGLRRGDGEEMEVSAVVLKHGDGSGIPTGEDRGM
ncbi:MAG: response regulator, partial [Phycisphaerae bacterium]|nr:response regulator [Phycisphaerae bacterium]